MTTLVTALWIKLINFFKEQLIWLKSGLFWRTFFFLTFAIFLSLVTWISSLRVSEERPLVQQIASQLLSIITITRAALVHSAPESRQHLLFELAHEDGIRIFSFSNSDVMEPAPKDSFMPELQKIVRKKLGSETLFSRRVNGVEGFWVSFKSGQHYYWLVLDQKRFDPESNLRWISWSALILLMSVLAAMVITRLINQPLLRLSQAARAISEGQFLKPLPETGIAEIRDTNKSFNQMAQELTRIESDRTLILAGISHDLRTPLARLQLEVELAHLPDAARAGIQSDINQMDAIIGQFLDFAKPMDSVHFSHFNLSSLLESIVQSAQRLPDIKIEHHITSDLFIAGNAIEISRLMNNLIENARRYGKTPGKNYAEVTLICKPQERNKTKRVVMQFSDKGHGIPEEDVDRLLRPFTRVDSARSQANGAGLGLAIVQRIAQQHRATIRLTNDHGLFIEMLFNN